jgi:hypothetical protein
LTARLFALPWVRLCGNAIGCKPGWGGETLAAPHALEIELLRSLRLLVSGVRGFMRFCRMVVRKLGMLGRVCLVTLFMGFCGVPMRLGSFIVVGCGFVVVVFWHFGSGCC